MKAIILPLWLTLATTLPVSPTTGSGPTALEKLPMKNSQALGHVGYADQYPGSDLGAQINAAVTNLGTDFGMKAIPSGSTKFPKQVPENKEALNDKHGCT